MPDPEHRRAKICMRLNFLKKFALVAFLAPCASAIAVGGISNTKLVVPGANPVDYQAFELGLTLGMYRQTYRFDEFSHRTDIPNDYNRLAVGEQKMSQSANTLGFRLTDGIYPNTEVGISFGHSAYADSIGTEGQASFEEAQLGIKYLLNPGRPMRFALQGGINFDPVSWSPSYEGGAILTYDITRKFSVDMDLLTSVSSPIHREQDTFIERGVGGNIGIGYFFGRFQPIVEIGYFEKSSIRRRNPRISEEFYYLTSMGVPYEYNINESMGLPSGITVDGIPVSLPVIQIQERVHYWSRKWTASTGFTFITHSGTVVIFGVSEDLRGMNEYGGKYVSLAATFTFNGRSETSPPKEDEKPDPPEDAGRSVAESR